MNNQKYSLLNYEFQNHVKSSNKFRNQQQSNYNFQLGYFDNIK